MFRSAVVLLCLCSSSIASGQERPRSAPDQDDIEVIKIDTDLIPIDVTVTNANGEIVRTLRKEDFKLFEDGIERPISFFSVEKKGDALRPVAIVFALDISGSMTIEEIERLRVAVRTFVSRMANRTSVFAVIAFGMEVKTLQGFTNDQQKLERVFDRIARDPSGLSTHAYDAVDDAIRLLVRKAPRTKERRLMKRGVVLVSDGFPVGDTVAPATVIERANAADVSVYTVTLPSFSRVPMARSRAPLPTPLDVSGLADKTGGINIYATDKDFESLFSALAEDVASSYILAFYPPPENRKDGKVHSIRVEVARGLTVRQSRPSYTSSDK
jgi:VWFA-related protein